jgi:hypothetical protein
MSKQLFKIDQKALISTRKALNRLFPYDSKTQTAIWRGMRDASKPMKTALKRLIKTEAKDSGRLNRSIKIFRAKKLDKYNRPSAYIGPKIKAPKTKKYKDPETQQKWYEKFSGYYFYYLEYGFIPWGGRNKQQMIGGLGLLPKAVNQGGPQSMAILKRSIEKQLEARIKKTGLGGSFKL